MKAKFWTLILVVLFIGTAVSITFAVSDKANKKAKKNAPVLEKIVFVHWHKGFAKPSCNNDGICDPGEKPSCGDCKSKGGDEEPPTTLCYDFMGQYGKKLLEWRTLPVQFVINPLNPDGLSTDLITSAIGQAALEWDSYTIPGLIDYSFDISTQVQYGVQDYQNAFVFGGNLEPGVIAVTKVWFSPATKQIVEFDIKFNTAWIWGDAENPDTPAVMDLQNIGIHELGHALGLDDIYDESCSDVTMYGYSDYGEISKRDIEEPDIIGINMLYE